MYVQLQSNHKFMHVDPSGAIKFQPKHPARRIGKYVNNLQSHLDL
ncbi:hypothetical protein ACVWW1_000188 [Bradyrhizobium sp. JR3.5]